MGSKQAGSDLAVVCGSEMFPMEMKEIGDLAKCRDEPLTLLRRFEVHHMPLSSRQREMRIFGTVVQTLMRSMLTAEHQLSNYSVYSTFHIMRSEKGTRRQAEALLRLADR